MTCLYWNLLGLIIRALTTHLRGELKTCPQHDCLGTTMDHDAIIIGAGPAGLFAATEIAKRGFDVRVLEEHERVGEPDHCAGLLSTSGLNRLGVNLPDEVIQNTVSGAIIYSPSGHTIKVERGKREARVIDRRRFDAWLATRATDQGVEVTTNTKVSEIGREGVLDYRVKVRGKINTELTSNVYIIAEGSRCQLSGSIGLPIVEKSSKYPAFQYEVSGVDIDDGLVEMFYGRNVAPGFFAWIIPLGEKRARVGLAARNKSKIRLDALIHHHKIVSKRMEGAKIERSLGGIVLVGLPIARMTNRNVIAVGDTAGIVKATTGGGVILGGLTAKLAGKIIAEALSSSAIARGIQQYEKQWKSMISNELRTMYLAQLALSSLSDKGLDSIIKDAANLGLLDAVKSEGDMDLQGSVIKKLLTNPRMVLTGLRAIRYINPFL
jgi:digeranylgeranylglycerophospholipid reductase